MPYKDIEKRREVHRKHRRNNLEKFAVRQKAYYVAKPVKYLLLVCRSRCKKLGIPCELTESDIVIPEFCPILGIKLERGTKKSHDFAPTIDRFDPSKGYVKGNVAVVSFRANRLKYNYKPEEIRRFLDWFVERDSKEQQTTNSYAVV